MNEEYDFDQAMDDYDEIGDVVDGDMANDVADDMDAEVNLDQDYDQN